MAIRQSTQAGGEDTVLAAAAADRLSVGDVIDLYSKPPQRGGPRDRTIAAPLRRIGAPRIDPRAVAVGVSIADMLVVAAAAFGTHLLQQDCAWPTEPVSAITALAITAMIVRAPSAQSRFLRDWLRRPLFHRLTDGSLRVLLPFVLSVVVLMTLLPAGDPMRIGLIHWLVLWGMGAVLGVCGVRASLVGLIARWKSRGRLKEAIAVFGTGALAERLIERLNTSSVDAVELVGVFDDRTRRRIADPGIHSLPAGTADDLIALSRHRDIDRVLVALPHSAEQRVVDVLKKLHQMPVEISLAPDLVAYDLPCAGHPDELAGLPFVDVYEPPLTFDQILLKSTIDRVFAALLLVTGAPLFVVLALAIKLDSAGPVLFRQNRHGFGDRTIGVYKFRTMYAEAADHDGTVQASRNDPRITRIGHFVRRWSLDEFPQLLNVLRGEMSLIGPRPHAVSMTVENRPNRDIVPNYPLRHHVKPGITGWAQVNGCHGPVETVEGLHARLRYDLHYITNWSLWFDLRIVLLTIKILLGPRHDY